MTVLIRPVLANVELVRVPDDFERLHEGLTVTVGQGGAPLTVVQQQLRHGDAKTTLQKYGHVVGDSQRRAIHGLAEKIESLAVELEPGAELESSAA
jgi:hypothetical protein